MTDTVTTPSNDAAPLDEVARRLEAIVLRSAAFVDDHLARLRELAPTGLKVVDANSDEAKAAWREEQADWERRRAVEEARIDEQLDHLTQAWHDLEVEQRRLMMRGQLSPDHTHEHEPPDATDHRADAPATEPPRPDPSLDLNDAADPMSASSAAFQFQKLKREIRQQSQRRR